MLEYKVPRALYLATVPNQPDFDTLFGICNPFGTAQTFEIHCYDVSGAEVPNSPVSYTLEPGHSVATTFITNNVFPNPPQGWQGFATIRMLDPTGAFGAALGLPTMVAIGGDGPGLMNWNYMTANVQMYNTPQVPYGTGRRWVFPYLIPYFFDKTQHAGEHVYDCGLAIENAGAAEVTLTIAYTVGDFYANAMTKVQTTVTIPAGTQGVWRICELLPEVLTMNPLGDGTYEGSEGWLDITSEADATLSMYMLNANVTYNYLGWGQAPWMI